MKEKNLLQRIITIGQLGDKKVEISKKEAKKILRLLENGVKKVTRKPMDGINYFTDRNEH